jgi:formylglycine-generating enzyme required for sulfatase activity
MGSNSGDSDEKPVHSVTLSDYYMGKFEVTQAQWRAVMGNNPSHFKNCNTCPVEKVSWNDIQQFLKKLRQLTGRNFTLPTEAQWEYAARGGKKSKGYKYAGSNSIGNVAWYDSNSSSKTHPVGRKSPNELGLYDMSGNVWEWCSDWYGDAYYKNSPSRNPKGPSSGANRVLRGGGWYGAPAYCRVANRDRGMPTYRDGNIGFRCAVSL